MESAIFVQKAEDHGAWGSRVAFSRQEARQVPARQPRREDADERGWHEKARP